MLLTFRETEAGIYFGDGANTFELEFVTIGNPGNESDSAGQPTSVGAVSYSFQIGKYEISRDAITKYNSGFGNGNSLSITMQSAYGGNNSGDAAGGITWNEAARFVNWLNTSKGHSAAYKFTDSTVSSTAVAWSSTDDGYDANNPHRNSKAVYVIPTVDEWYKAAYYDPNTSQWREYASLDGSLPTATASSTNDNEAVYDQDLDAGPANVKEAGGLNAYGIMAMNGNVREWDENVVNSTNRGIRGGAWNENQSFLSATFRNDRFANNDEAQNGFRVVSLSTTSSNGGSTSTVPEPSATLALGSLGVAILLRSRRSRRRAIR